MHEKKVFSRKTTNTLVGLVMKNDLAKICVTTLNNQRAEVISRKSNFPLRPPNSSIHCSSTLAGVSCNMD